MSGLFVERVMAAVAQEPRPTPLRSFGAAIVRLSLRDAVAALWTGWRLATVPDRRVTPRAQVSSRALLVTIMAVLVVGVSLAAADRFLQPAPNGPASQGTGPVVPAGVEDVGPGPTDQAPDRHRRRDRDRPVQPRPHRAVSPAVTVEDKVTTHAQKSGSGGRRRTGTTDHHVVRTHEPRDDDDGDDQDGGREHSDEPDDDGAVSDDHGGGDDASHEGSGSGDDGGSDRGDGGD